MECIASKRIDYNPIYNDVTEFEIKNKEALTKSKPNEYINFSTLLKIFSEKFTNFTLNSELANKIIDSSYVSYLGYNSMFKFLEVGVPLNKEIRKYGDSKTSILQSVWEEDYKNLFTPIIKEKINTGTKDETESVTTLIKKELTEEYPKKKKEVLDICQDAKIFDSLNEEEKKKLAHYAKSILEEGSSNKNEENAKNILKIILNENPKLLSSESIRIALKRGFEKAIDKEHLIQLFKNLDTKYHSHFFNLAIQNNLTEFTKEILQYQNLNLPLEALSENLGYSALRPFSETNYLATEIIKETVEGLSSLKIKENSIPQIYISAVRAILAQNLYLNKTDEEIKKIPYNEDFLIIDNNLREKIKSALEQNLKEQIMVTEERERRGLLKKDKVSKKIVITEDEDVAKKIFDDLEKEIIKPQQKTEKNPTILAAEKKQETAKSRDEDKASSSNNPKKTKKYDVETGNYVNTTSRILSQPKSSPKSPKKEKEKEKEHELV